MQDMDTTYRLVALGDHSNVGQTAATPELAKLAPGNLYREGNRLGIERTDWVDHFGKPKVHRTILIEAESQPGEWKIGPDSDQPVVERRVGAPVAAVGEREGDVVAEEVVTQIRRRI